MAAMPELPPCHLVYIGGGRLLGALQGHGGRAGARGRACTSSPPCRLAELLAWTASADIGVQPIRNTCLNHLSTDSNKLFEYAMAGLPVVASDFPEIRRVVAAHDIGLLFDPETPGRWPPPSAGWWPTRTCGRGSPPTPGRAPGR